VRVRAGERAPDCKELQTVSCQSVIGRSPTVVVVGSINVDYVMRVPRRPVPGETVSDAVLEIHAGGKGANQAVASAGCGAQVEMVGRVGYDATAEGRIANLAAEGVGTAHVSRTEGVQTGAAFISVTPDGENSIIAAAGANAMLAAQDIDSAAPVISGARVLVTQLEVPVPAVVRAAQVAGPGPLIVLNYAPYCPTPDDLLRRVDVLVANESESAALTAEPFEDLESARRAARLILGRGPRAVVITLGPLGALVVTPDEESHVAAPEVQPVDTTGAGDAFVGALAAHLAAGEPLATAVRFGTEAGSATTEQRGASPVIPASVRLSP
jgi:ribokinase